MKRSTLVIVGVVVAAVLAAWFFLRGGAERVAVDLMAQFPSATERRPRLESFTVGNATIGGVTLDAIQPNEPSRVMYTVTVPERAVLKVSLGVLEAGWNVPGDGVLFKIIFADSRGYADCANLVLNPSGSEADRGWREVECDLSEYAGETISILFNTNSSAPQRPPKDDRNGDLPAWGAPRIVTR
jgi:hypothetical protein